MVVFAVIFSFIYDLPSTHVVEKIGKEASRLARQQHVSDTETPQQCSKSQNSDSDDIDAGCVLGQQQGAVIAMNHKILII